MKNEKKNKICKTKKRPEPEGSWPLKNSPSNESHWNFGFKIQIGVGVYRV